MAFSRKFLAALGIEEDKIGEIITAHTEVTDALKADRDKYKSDAEKLPKVQEELDTLKSQQEDGKNPWQVKYEALKEQFNEYKADQTAKETKATKEAAYKKLLKDAGVAEKLIASVLRVTDFDSVELDKDGNIKDADKHTESIKTEWADFIQTTQTKGVNTNTPPVNGGSVTSREEIYKKDDNGRFVYDAAQRQEMLTQIINQKG